MPSSANSTTKKKLAGLTSNRPAAGKDTFLTEAEIQEIEEQLPNDYQPMSFEDMLKEVDSLTCGLKRGDEDLQELKKRISRCNDNMKVRHSTMDGLSKSVKEIDTHFRNMQKNMESYPDLGNISDTD